MEYSTYDSADMLFDIMGFGKAPGEPGGRRESVRHQGRPG
jgi:hypothetical protein